MTAGLCSVMPITERSSGITFGVVSPPWTWMELAVTFNGTVYCFEHPGEASGSEEVPSLPFNIFRCIFLSSFRWLLGYLQKRRIPGRKWMYGIDVYVCTGEKYNVFLTFEGCEGKKCSKILLYTLCPETGSQDVRLRVPFCHFFYIFSRENI